MLDTSWYYNPANSYLYCIVASGSDVCYLIAKFDGRSDNSLLTQIELQDMISPFGLQLRSITEGSNKIFNITVDDSGNLSTKEVSPTLYS